jgi:hypothetical protein
VPLLGFGKERLDPHLPFAHRLLIGLGEVVAAHFIEVVLVEGAVDHAPVVTGRALRFDRTDVAGRRVGAVEHLLFGELGLATQQELPLRAAVDVSLGVVDELVLSEKQCPAIEIGQGEVRPDARIFDADDVLDRAIGVSPVTWSGRSLRRKQTRQSRSRSGTFSMTSAGVTRAAKMMRCFPPSTM